MCSAPGADAFAFRQPPYDLADAQRRFVEHLLAANPGAAFRAASGYPMDKKLKSLRTPLTVFAPHDDILEQTQRVRPHAQGGRHLPGSAGSRRGSVPRRPPTGWRNSSIATCPRRSARMHRKLNLPESLLLISLGMIAVEAALAHWAIVRARYRIRTTRSPRSPCRPAISS